MENFKILSMNLGRGFIPIKDKRKKEFLREKIDTEKYDVIMLQGNGVARNNFFKEFGYNYADSSKDIITLVSNRSIVESKVTDVFNCSIISNINRPLVLINVNCKDLKGIDKLFTICDICSKEKDVHYVKSRIVAGRFPKAFDTNEFCDQFDLDDVSTLVGYKSHIKNNRDMVNHFFVSRNLEIQNIHKLVGMTEVSKIGEAYPLEVTLKKVLK